jgi:DNA-binding NarL/FixJ family response regulator
VNAEAKAAEVLTQARGAFARSEWATARELFEQALAERPSAEALDGLGQVLWWLGEEEAAIETRAKAFAEYSREGDAEAAANVAIYLAAEYRIAGNASLANGWLGRCARLLEGCEDCTARVWHEIELSKRAAASDPAAAEGHANRAIEMARGLRDAGLESAAMSHAGRAQVSQGAEERGLAILDEALAIAISVEEGDPLAIGDACCTTLTACERLHDPQRALDWGRAISDFFERRRYLPLLGWCRTVYAEFLIATGRWREAEDTLESALAAEATLPHPNRAGTLLQLGDLRVRQGRLEEAERLLAGLEDRPAALRTVVQLHLARGDVDLAAEKVGRQLEGVRGDRGAAAPLLVLHAEIELERGDGTAAAGASREASDAAELSGRPDLVALAHVLEARAAMLAGETPDDASALEAAIVAFSALGMPIEEGVARGTLARVLAPTHPQSAIEQGRAALALFDELGAARHADAAAGLLRNLGAPGRAAPRSAAALTKREQQVLALLGEGLSNPLIAERLVISPRTAEHHVRNILAKLELKNRAEAAAYVARGGARADLGP